MTLNLQTSITALGFSNRTTNALIRNGIKEIQDLYVLCDMQSKNEIGSLRGIGENGIREIYEFMERSTNADAVQRETYSFGSFWESIQRDERNLGVLVDYYNNSALTLQDLADTHHITRERIRQIIDKGTKRLHDAFMNGVIDSKTVAALDAYANNRTEIRMIELSDELFSAEGILRLVSAFKPTPYHLYSSPVINGEWFIRSDDDLKKIVDIIVDDLKYRPEPLLLSEIQSIYSINEEIIMSIKGIIEKDGYVTHKKNKVVTGTDRHSIITRYLESINRPASLHELVENTSLSENQVRGAISDKTRYVNVGKSTYDLVERDYKDLSAVELTSNILLAENRALKLDAVLKYVQRYKDISEQGFFFQLIDDASNTDTPPKFEYIDGYLLLSGWDQTMIEKKTRTTFAITLEDAVLRVINSSDDIFGYEKIGVELKEKYEGQVSNNPSSIKATLVRLSDKGLITRVGGSKTGIYTRNKELSGQIIDTIQKKSSLNSFINAHIGDQIEIIYKTNRVKSDKYWRTISIRGQDARYIYTNDLNPYGYRVTYVKEKVVDYREHSPRQDDKTKQNETISNSLEVGESYSNDDLVTIFKVSSQGKMRKSVETNSLVLIIDRRGYTAFGNAWHNGRIDYTGIGLYDGHRLDNTQNKTLAESKMNGITVYLFESYAANSYTYRGIVELDGEPFFEKQKDWTSRELKVIKFPLRLVQTN